MTPGRLSERAANPLDRDLSLLLSPESVNRSDWFTRLGEHVYARFPALRRTDLGASFDGMSLSYFTDVAGAVKSANSSLPLGRQVVEHGPVRLPLDNISYYPADEILQGYLGVRLCGAGITRTEVRSRETTPRELGHVFRDPRPQSGTFLQHTDVTGHLLVDGEPGKPLSGTLTLDGIDFPGFPEITPGVLWKGVYDKGAHGILHAQNLSAQVLGSAGLPAGAKLTLYTQDRDGSAWSIHCRTPSNG